MSNFFQYKWNYRDLAESSPALRKDKIYRSSDLVNISADQYSGIDYLIDLRSYKEVCNRMHPKELNTTLIHSPEIKGNIERKVRFRDVCNDPDLRNKHLIEVYSTFPTTLETSVSDVIVTLANSRSEDRIVFHCVLGKDRTGFVSAVLLALMGATKTEIVDDYMQTYNKYKLAHGEEVMLDRPITISEEFIKASLEALNKEWMSAYEYVLHCVDGKEKVLNRAISQLST